MLISFLARLPAAMCPIGALLLVNEHSDTISGAGLVAGALALGQAVGGPLIGRRADRHGQRPLVLLTSLLNATALTLLVLAALADLPIPVQAALALLTGLFVPQIGPLNRSRLISRHRGDPARTSSALSLDGAIDETSFVTGPALIGILALADPAAGLLLAAALVASFGTAFALHPASTRPPTARPSRTPVLSVPLALLIAGMFLQGVVFGSIQTGVTDLTEKLGHPGAAGLIYGLMGVPSALVGLAMVALPPRPSLRTRLRLATAAMFLISLSLLTVNDLLTLTTAVCVLGLTFAPTIITTFNLTERAAPPSRMSEAMTMLGSGIILGTSTGAALSGVLAESSGHTAAFALTCTAAAISTLIALRPSTRRPRKPEAVLHA